MKIVAIILTFNEELHLARCISSLKDVANEIVVVDSFSTDSTLHIARSLGVRVLQRGWLSHSDQFNWALTQLTPDADWVLRIDADETVSGSLAREIKADLSTLSSTIDGVYCSRLIKFQGKLIRHGGVFRIRVLRLFRFGQGRCENRWMDEHIKVVGSTHAFRGEILDDNLNSLTWWTEKHNNYASREAIDLLNLEFGFMPRDSIAKLVCGDRVRIKRWAKERLYARLHGGTRAALYFLYRYVVRLGFLDGQTGTVFHFLQGFWYRYLVDAKVTEVKRCMRVSGLDVATAIKSVLNISV